MKLSPLQNFNSKKLKEYLIDYTIYIVFLGLFIAFIIVDPSILSLNSIQAILTQSATRIIMALGVGGIIILGGNDLSSGRMIGLAAVVSASLLQDPDAPRRVFPNLPQLPMFVPFLLVMVICAVFSICQGLVVFKLQVPAFIAGLGLQLVIFGAASMYFQESNNASPINSLDTRFTSLAQGTIKMGQFKMPYIVLISLFCCLLIWVFWNKTKVGRNMYAIGGNKEAAAVSGVDILKNALVVYLIAGLLYGFAGALEAGRTGSATNVIGQGYECDAISACVVGGASLRGGVGTVPGVIIGALRFQLINYGLVYLGVNPFMQYIVKGIIIVIAVAIDTQKYVRKK